MGDPRNGHQCYKTINIENKLCFDGKSIGKNCFFLIKQNIRAYRSIIVDTPLAACRCLAPANKLM